MAPYVIWMDSEKVHVFALRETGIEKSTVVKRGFDHHTHNKKDHHGDPASDLFFAHIASRLKDAEQLLILGPGLAKTHFQTYLERHHTGHLEKRIVGMEDTDHPTDGQILAQARKFFEHYNLFNSPIQAKG